MNILFMCVANSARSQLAEGIARQLFPKAQVQSAGSHPGKLNPYAVTVMHEIGIDISHHFSKSFADLSGSFKTNLNFVITLCAEEVCPIIDSKAQKYHWPFPDPVTTESLSEVELLLRFRAARDAIRLRLEKFKGELQG